jgi:cytochrome b involved in lipid metabolism
MTGGTMVTRSSATRSGMAHSATTRSGMAHRARIHNHLEAARPAERNGGLARPRTISEDFLGQPVFDRAEVAAHRTQDELWLSAHGRVYDITAMFAAGGHPGGARSLLSHAGKDCSSDFDFHSVRSRRDWAQYQVGWLRDADSCSPLLGLALWALSTKRLSPAA